MDPPPNTKPSEERQALVCNLIALLCGIWFLLTGWMWTFLMCLVISYPVGIFGFILWWRGQKLVPGMRLGRVAVGFLGVGLAISLVAIFLFK